MNRFSTSSEISFHGLPNKSKRRPIIRKQIASSLSSQLIVLLFLRNSHLQRDIYQTFFRQYFCELLENSCSPSKKHLWRSFILVMLQAFTEASTRVLCRKGIIRKALAKFPGKHLFQRLYFNKIASLKETLAQLFPCEISEISQNIFLT